MRSSRRLLVAGSLAVVVVAFGACGGGGGGGASGAPGGSSGGGEGGALGEGGGHTFGDDGPVGNPSTTCDAGCPMGTTCDFGVCLPPQPTCVTNADCEYDTYCQVRRSASPTARRRRTRRTIRTCTLRTVPPGAFAPTVFCEFPAAAPAGDPFPTYVDVQATPIVVNFNRRLGDARRQRAIAEHHRAVHGHGRQRHRRLHGERSGSSASSRATTARSQANLGGVDLDGDGVVDWVNSPSAVAAGDLDGDGVAEIVAYTGDLSRRRVHAQGEHVGAALDEHQRDDRRSRPFVSTTARPRARAARAGSGPSIHDIDNDGKPEIIVEGYVINGQTGVLMAAARATTPATASASRRCSPTSIRTGKAELTNGSHVWDFDARRTPGSTTRRTRDDDEPAGLGRDRRLQSVRRQDGARDRGRLEQHDLRLQPRSLRLHEHVRRRRPGRGGGPPTIADYDGDGLPEIGLAGGTSTRCSIPTARRRRARAASAQRWARRPATPPSRSRTTPAPQPRPSVRQRRCPTYVLWSRSRRTTRRTSPAAPSSTSRRPAPPRSSTRTSASRASTPARRPGSVLPVPLVVYLAREPRRRRRRRRLPRRARRHVEHRVRTRSA
jgi:hypothetical protein